MKKIKYKEFIIEIHPQPENGDYNCIYFGILENTKKLFGLWCKISGTESRSMSKEDIFKLLEEKGINRVKKIIDNSSFKNGDVFTTWESKN